MCFCSCIFTPLVTEAAVACSECNIHCRRRSGDKYHILAVSMVCDYIYIYTFFYASRIPFIHQDCVNWKPYIRNTFGIADISYITLFRNVLTYPSHVQTFFWHCVISPVLKSWSLNRRQDYCNSNNNAIVLKSKPRSSSKAKLKKIFFFKVPLVTRILNYHSIFCRLHESRMWKQRRIFFLTRELSDITYFSRRI